MSKRFLSLSDDEEDDDKTVPYADFDPDDEQCLLDIAKEIHLRRVPGLRYIDLEHEFTVWEQKQQKRQKKQERENENKSTATPKPTPTAATSSTKSRTKSSDGDEDETFLQNITKKNTENGESSSSTSSNKTPFPVQKKGVPFIPTEEDDQTVDALSMLETAITSKGDGDLHKLAKLYSEDHFRRLQVILHEQTYLHRFYKHEQLTERFKAYRKLQSGIEADLGAIDFPELLFGINPNSVNQSLGLLMSMIQFDEAIIKEAKKK